MALFRVGDECLVVGKGCGLEGQRVVITEIGRECEDPESPLCYYFEDEDGSGCHDWQVDVGQDHELQLIERGDNNMSQQVTTQDLQYLKLSAEDRLLYDGGLIDQQGQATDEGIQLSNSLTFDANRKALVAIARDIKAARKTDTPESE